MSLSKYHVLTQFLRFSGAGIIGTAGHYATLVIMVEIGHVDAVAASGSGFLVGALINYHLNRRYIFRSTVPHRSGLPKFMTIAFGGLVLNTALMNIFTQWLHYLVAQIAVTAMVLVWNFFGNRLWTFRERQECK